MEPALFERYPAELQRPTHQSAVLMIGIDSPSCNDTYGHLAGDRNAGRRLLQRPISAPLISSAASAAKSSSSFSPGDAEHAVLAAEAPGRRCRLLHRPANQRTSHHFDRWPAATAQHGAAELLHRPTGPSPPKRGRRVTAPRSRTLNAASGLSSRVTARLLQ